MIVDILSCCRCCELWACQEKPGMEPENDDSKKTESPPEKMCVSCCFAYFADLWRWKLWDWKEILVAGYPFRTQKNKAVAQISDQHVRRLAWCFQGHMQHGMDLRCTRFHLNDSRIHIVFTTHLHVIHKLHISCSFFLKNCWSASYHGFWRSASCSSIRWISDGHLASYQKQLAAEGSRRRSRAVPRFKPVELSTKKGLRGRQTSDDKKGGGNKHRCQK